jgi:methylase of polypeptide subunit release factors
MTDSTPLSRNDAALASILDYLYSQAYRFITITPLTHARVLARRTGETASTLRDVFGWNLPFTEEALPPAILTAMDAAGMLDRCGEQLRSKVRVSSIDDALFLHSAYPTQQEDAVFFGPDTYRFVRFMRQALAGTPPVQGMRILDIGCGSGAGGLMLAQHCPGAQLVLNDINPLALRYAGLNARSLGTPVQLVQGDSVNATHGEFDLIIANPPYLVDKDERAYRHGGDQLGSALSLRMASESLPRLAHGGRLLLYTGVAIVDGVDGLLQELKPLLTKAGCNWRYQEIDPDVFGEELEQSAYAHVDRIAAVGLEACRNIQNGQAVTSLGGDLQRWPRKPPPPGREP